MFVLEMGALMHVAEEQQKLLSLANTQILMSLK
jgi:hypothetical protein